MGIVVAGALHAAIVAVMLVSWQHKLEIADQSAPVVPVDLVTIADKTNIAPTVARVEPPAVTPQSAAAPPPVPILAPVPPPQAEAAPEPAPSVTPKPAPPPTPQVKPAPPKPAPAKAKVDDVNALIDNILKPAAPQRNARVADRTVKGIGDMSASTADLATALKNKIDPCWTRPTGGPHPDQLIVTFRLFLNPDGGVAQPPQLSADSASAAASDPYMRAAAESARRAIYTCAPYKLPADKYGTWRDITVDFDPRQAPE